VRREVRCLDQRVSGRSRVGRTARGHLPCEGEAVYEERCRFCHDVGLHGAPQPGNPWRWPKPTEENIDRLARRAECGERVMRPKGTCQTCTIDDIKAAIRYMIEYKR
jgi:cytochrome c5